MNEYAWYALAEGEDLQQGDLLFGCSFDQLVDSEVVETTHDVVVVSHSCDLAHEKLTRVQVCPFWELGTLAKDIEYFRGRRGREELRRGNLPGYYLLNRCTLTEVPTDYLVADFRMQFAVKAATLKALVANQQQRVRLLPPYREHLAQALARFYMRVGLPVDIPAF